MNNYMVIIYKCYKKHYELMSVHFSKDKHSARQWIYADYGKDNTICNFFGKYNLSKKEEDTIMHAKILRVQNGKHIKLTA